MTQTANVTIADTGKSKAKVHAKDLLAAKKKEQSENITKAMPKSGVDVTYPGFISHNQSMAVMAQCGVTHSSAKKSAEGKRKLVAVMISTFCTFGPSRDKISHSDVGELLSNEDTSWLSTRLLGSDDEEEDATDLGNR